jgi:nucleotide-binding universal stress UspA family protein
VHKNIMVSYDGSEESLDALEEAKQVLGTSADMRLSIVQVASDGEIDAPVELTWCGTMSEYQSMDPQLVAERCNRLIADREDQLHKELDAHVAGLPNPVEMHAIVQTASIADSLLDFAKQHDVDLIVMGCRGLGAIRGVLGSVSYAVLRAAQVPVLIVK